MSRTVPTRKLIHIVIRSLVVSAVLFLPLLPVVCGQEGEGPRALDVILLIDISTSMLNIDDWDDDDPPIQMKAAGYLVDYLRTNTLSEGIHRVSVIHFGDQGQLAASLQPVDEMAEESIYTRSSREGTDFNAVFHQVSHGLAGSLIPSHEPVIVLFTGGRPGTEDIAAGRESIDDYFEATETQVGNLARRGYFLYVFLIGEEAQGDVEVRWREITDSVSAETWSIPADANRVYLRDAYEQILRRTPKIQQVILPEEPTVNSPIRLQVRVKNADRLPVDLQQMPVPVSDPLGGVTTLQLSRQSLAPGELGRLVVFADGEGQFERAGRHTVNVVLEGRTSDGFSYYDVLRTDVSVSETTSSIVARTAGSLAWLIMSVLAVAGSSAGAYLFRQRSLRAEQEWDGLSKELETERESHVEAETEITKVDTQLQEVQKELAEKSKELQKLEKRRAKDRAASADTQAENTRLMQHSRRVAEELAAKSQALEEVATSLQNKRAEKSNLKKRYDKEKQAKLRAQRGLRAEKRKRKTVSRYEKKLAELLAKAGRFKNQGKVAKFGECALEIVGQVQAFADEHGEEVAGDKVEKLLGMLTEILDPEGDNPRAREWLYAIITISSAGVEWQRRRVARYLTTLWKSEEHERWLLPDIYSLLGEGCDRRLFLDASIESEGLISETCEVFYELSAFASTEKAIIDLSDAEASELTSVLGHARSLLRKMSDGGKYPLSAQTFLIYDCLYKSCTVDFSSDQVLFQLDLEAFEKAPTSSKETRDKYANMFDNLFHLLSASQEVQYE